MGKSIAKGRAGFLAALPLLLGACQTPVGVRTVGEDAVSHELAANAIDDGRLSNGSMQLLVYLDLDDEYAEDTDAAFEAVHELAVAESNGDLVLLLSEVAYLKAAREGSRTCYLGSAVYAFQYLFGDFEVGRPSAYSPRFHLACALYNEGLTRALLGEDGQVEFPDGDFELPVGSIRLVTDRARFPWDSEQFPGFVTANRYRLRGLSVRVREEGLGVPLVAVPPAVENHGKAPYVPLTDVPATAFLRVSGGIGSARAGLAGTLELHSGFSEPRVVVAGRTVPLQVDLSTPLALSADSPGPWIEAFTDFLGWTRPMDQGLHLFQPYERGKIPVVFIHGTASAPIRWTGMFNGLLADERLRTHYQAWFFKYASGNPIPHSANLLRRALRKARDDLDPGGDDPGFGRMVLIGHSQGGLMAKLLAVNSGNDLWDSVSVVPIDEFPLEQHRELLRERYVLEAEPYVSRIVFLATPHRGSFLADKWYGRMVAGWIPLEPDLRELHEELFSDPTLWREGVLPKGGAPNSLDNLAEDNPFLAALDELPVAPGVRTHSIIAVFGPGPLEEEDDRLVAYRSAHREDTDSEVVIRSSHGCQSHPDAVQEVRRILLEHLREGGGNGPGSAPEGP